jgi:secreted trypsin-like serine protease
VYYRSVSAHNLWLAKPLTISVRDSVTTSILNSAEANDVRVVMIVDGVTRQLQTLLKRSGGYVLACAGASGGPCLFKGGETTEAVALGELPVAGMRVE